MKAPEGLLPIEVSCPNHLGQVDVGSHDAKLLVIDTSAEHAEYMKAACNFYEAVVKALLDVQECLRRDVAGDEVPRAENIIATVLTAAGVA